MKKLLFCLLMLCAVTGFAQDLNSYKYVVVPDRFELQRATGEFNLNNLVAMMFEKNGFTVYRGQELPDELIMNRCKALYADLAKESNMLKTGVIIKLKDCKGKEVFVSEKGESKQKNVQRAYYEALREASASVEALNYQYNGETETVTIQTPVTKTETVTVYVPSATPQAEQVVNIDMLFAQPIANGYQLVDSTPKVVLKIYKTSQQDSFTAVGEGKNGVVFKKGNDWFFEYYQNDKLISEKLNIKF
ncbi:hypothetical protein KJK34_05555 [Flavobacterium sp. D11R37]|uniref:hypothetical protein n=1 Tax=Flavobacterium coralii TaxID=2838017 RepID=UPI001CA685A8|nr:hypothetical protein [Flavobacterium coralii]MBY8962211.1 hypothetical protein [Flavobacterium coralii]